MINLENIQISYNNKECINNGTFKASQGKITGIYGESGTGKSSLLYMIGMLSNQHCDYYYKGELLKLNAEERDQFRYEHISFITQNSVLIETLSVEKNIEFFLSLSDTDYKVDDLLMLVDLKDKKDAMPKSLSGGERQRVAIACAIAKDSDIILGDEITSALDEDNKRQVMNLLRECAKQGKTVILVSHEKKVLDVCDSLYKIDHLELRLEKDSVDYDSLKTINNKKINIIKAFELLFHSNKKNNLLRLLISFVVIIVLFAVTSMIVSSSNISKDIILNLENVSNRKIIVYSDKSGAYQKNADYIPGINISDYASLGDKNIDKINKMNNIESIYNYYVFEDGMDKDGNWLEMQIVPKRNGKILEKKSHIDSPYYIYDDNGIEDTFFVSPYYKEEEFSQDKGVYVNSHLAYLYDMKVGDDLELTLNIPVALIESKVLNNLKVYGKEFYPTECIYESINYNTKIIGIIDSNTLYDSIVFMQYEEMERLIDIQVQKYQTNEIIINNDILEEYNIYNLSSYAKAIFIDDYENALGVKNSINELSDDIYAYYEYERVTKVMDEQLSLAKNSFKVTLIGAIIFVFGSFLIEIYFLRKYKSTYMMFTLLGVDSLKRALILLCHSVWQIINMLCIIFLIYIIASIPEILSVLKVNSLTDTLSHLPDFYYSFNALCSFDFIHFVCLFVLIIMIVVLGNVFVLKYYSNQDVTQWLRGE